MAAKGKLNFVINMLMELTGNAEEDEKKELVRLRKLVKTMKSMINPKAPPEDIELPDEDEDYDGDLDSLSDTIEQAGNGMLQELRAGGRFQTSKVVQYTSAFENGKAIAKALASNFKRKEAFYDSVEFEGGEDYDWKYAEGFEDAVAFSKHSQMASF